MKSPVRYLTDERYTEMPSWERALHVAASLVGQREEGRNAGPFVTKILGAVGLGPGFPWCAAFVSYALRKAGYGGGPSHGRAAVRNWAAWARKEGRIIAKPERGCLFYWLNSNLTGHIGFVAQVHEFKVTTIEGNTDDGGSREGDGTYRRERPIKGLGFIRLR